MDERTIDKRMKILIVITGGTICSETNEKNENQSNAAEMKKTIVAAFEKSKSPYADAVIFGERSLPEDILSENMTFKVWNELLKIFQDKTIWEDYKGIIVLHGTDTLAYTSSFLSLVLTGAPIPVIMVSSQLDLWGKEANGHANFRAAVELIMNGIKPNVYAVYRNMADEKNPYDSSGQIIVHFGAHLKQCANYSHNFYSDDGMTVENTGNAKLEGKRFETDIMLAERLHELSEDVLLIQPHTGMKYSRFNLDGVKAVVHVTYHSDTVCVERKTPNGANDNYTDRSILYLLEKCKEKNIPVIMSPCNKEAYTYTSTGDALRNGAFGVYGMTLEVAYVKTVLGVSLGKEGSELIAFLSESVNGEFVYVK